MLTIIFCTNAETMGCDPDQVAEYTEKIRNIPRNECVKIQQESSFKFWNGGPGNGSGYACLHIKTFGTVKSYDEARKAIHWLTSTGVNEWPSSDELISAFDTLDAICKINIPQIPAKRRIEFHNTLDLDGITQDQSDNAVLITPVPNSEEVMFRVGDAVAYGTWSDSSCYSVDHAPTQDHFNLVADALARANGD